MRDDEKDINIDHTNEGSQLTPLTKQIRVVSDDPLVTMKLIKTIEFNKRKRQDLKQTAREEQKSNDGKQKVIELAEAKFKDRLERYLLKNMHKFEDVLLDPPRKMAELASRTHDRMISKLEVVFKKQLEQRFKIMKELKNPVGNIDNMLTPRLQQLIDMNHGKVQILKDISPVKVDVKRRLEFYKVDGYYHKPRTFKEAAKGLAKQLLFNRRTIQH